MVADLRREVAALGLEAQAARQQHEEEVQRWEALVADLRGRRALPRGDWARQAGGFLKGGVHGTCSCVLFQFLR